LLLRFHLLRLHFAAGVVSGRCITAVGSSRSIGLARTGGSQSSSQVLRRSPLRIASSETVPAATWIFSSAGTCAAVGVTELFAQFCANQLVRRAITGAAEKYFQGARGPWIIFAWVGGGQRTLPACAAPHAGATQEECIKRGIFLRSPKSVRAAHPSNTASSRALAATRGNPAEGGAGKKSRRPVDS
jgi:hypothetical protein